MSNVQLSNSTLERLAARRTFPLHAGTTVCRNLFGPIDHDELNQEMKSKLLEISERDQRKWNFNFEAETPLAGAYKWEECPVDTAPVFYQESVEENRSVATSTGVKPCSAVPCLLESPSQDLLLPCEDRLASSERSTPSTSEVNQENCAVNGNFGNMIRKPFPFARSKRATSEITSTRITEFFVKRRRTTETNTNESSYHISSNSVAVELTPRKRIR